MHRSRWNVHSSCLLAASVWGATGCTVDTTSLLTIHFQQGHADVDVNCANGGCGGSDRLFAEVTLADSAQLPSDATVELTHYRVDYQVDPGGAPPFDAATSVVVGKGEAAPFAPRVAGDAQRQWAAGVGGVLAGLGTITVTGIDHQQEPVQITAKFEISFADFDSTSTSTSTTSSSSSGAGGAGGGG